MQCHRGDFLFTGWFGNNLCGGWVCVKRKPIINGVFLNQFYGDEDRFVYPSCRNCSRGHYITVIELLIIQIETMASSLRDSKCILDDEQDLLKLEQTFQQLKIIKDDKARQEQTISQLRANLQLLKNDNQLLRQTSPKRFLGNRSIPPNQRHHDLDRRKAKQVGRLKKLNQKDERENFFSAGHTYKESMFTPYPIGMLVGEDNHTQTKRKVINGFVDEMALELQRSTQILATERQAHQEDRVALENAEKEIVLLRSQLKVTEQSANSVYRENDFLKNQLAQQKSIRMSIEGQLMSKITTIDRYEKLFFRNSRAYDSQLQKMNLACLGLQREIGL